MLVNLTTVLSYAKEKDCAIGSFNTPTLESLQAVIQCAEELNVPVIIMHAEVHEPWAPLRDIGPMMVLAAKQAKVPVAVHLDHGEHIDYLEQALQIGFTSVMFDGSLLSYEENVRLTRIAVSLAKKYNASVEAEIGALGSREGGESTGGAVYTDPELALRFVNDTGIDALACSFGTAHGVYKEKPQLDFDRIEKISELTNLPLVMHGGSGVSKEDYLCSISLGIRKINYYTYMAKAGTEAVTAYLISHPNALYHELAHIAFLAMKDNAKEALKCFSK